MAVNLVSSQLWGWCPLGQRGLGRERSEFGSGKGWELLGCIIPSCWIVVPFPAVLWTCISNATLPGNVLFQVLVFLQEQAGVLYWLLFF